MIVCHCKRITDRQIAEMAHSGPGPRSCEDIARRSGAGAACRGCVPAICQILEQLERSARPQPARAARSGPA